MLQETVNGVPTGTVYDGPITVQYGDVEVKPTIEPFAEMAKARHRFYALREQGDFENVYLYIGDRIVESWNKSYDHYLESLDEEDEEENEGYS